MSASVTPPNDRGLTRLVAAAIGILRRGIAILNVQAGVPADTRAPVKVPGRHPSGESPVQSLRHIDLAAGAPGPRPQEPAPDDRYRQPGQPRPPGREALHLRLGRRPGRGRRDDARPAKRKTTRLTSSHG